MTLTVGVTLFKFSVTLILACKVVSFRDMATHQINSLLQEVALLKMLNHPNVVQYYDHFVDKNKKEFYIVMEYCEHGDLSHLIKRAIKKGSSIEEEFIFQVLEELASALKHCHSRPDGSVVLHQDLKPANVFLHQNLTVKMGDFGLAEILPTKYHFAHSKVGSRRYMSPEKTNDKVYKEKSDIWSLGCLIYYLCALK
ncbi:serine/threonine-protein kinase Nek2-like [Thalassophryne amazonica]|uniref:serine/threonine-protein kinase Nek2-like n=1 Tax=Thalassophryne amazonica TaxID=390379 RepID=UPI001471E4A3|nr:serine/threonine-protein kinase Nek2-like [Thalassophryne amazonica]